MTGFGIGVGCGAAITTLALLAGLGWGWMVFGVALVVAGVVGAWASS